jgi:excisionase family DNA binding protein
MNSPRHREKASPTLRPLAHSITSACAQLGIGRTKLYAMLSTGELESSKLGRRRVVTDRSIVALLDRTSVSLPGGNRLDQPQEKQPARPKFSQNVPMSGRRAGGGVG